MSTTSSRLSQYSSTSAESSARSMGEDSNSSRNESSYAAGAKSYRNRTQAWWTMGDLETGARSTTTGLTHQSAKFSLTGSRVFENQKDELWDLSDSLMELHESKQEEYEQLTLQLNQAKNKFVNPSDWMLKDSSHGFIRVFAPNTDYNTSHLIPCTLNTSAHTLCLHLGISPNALHIQLGGDIIRRLDPYEHPLVLQNDYLTGLGYCDKTRIQEQGCNADIGYLIRFYAGEPWYIPNI